MLAKSKKQEDKSSSSNNFKQQGNSGILQKALAIHHRNVGETSKLAKRHKELSSKMVFSFLPSDLQFHSCTKVLSVQYIQ